MVAVSLARSTAQPWLHECALHSAQPADVAMMYASTILCEGKSVFAEVYLQELKDGGLVWLSSRG